MGIEALLSTQIIDTTTVGRSVMIAVDAAAARTALGLGTLATQNGTITDYLTTAAAATNYQPLDGDLTALAALTGTDNLYYRSGAATWSSVTIGTGLTFTGGTLAASGGSGIGGSTGSTDNLVLRADGTGGATLQNSNLSIPDAYTASPNATVNHVSLQATGSTTNVSVSVVPKGTGAFLLKVPDGTTAGGNARGADSIDLQLATLANSANVASGTGSTILGSDGNSIASGNYCLASSGGQATGAYAVAFGRRESTSSLASGQNAFAIASGSASGVDAFAGGFQTTNSGSYGTFAFGDAVTVSGSRGATAFGDRSVADRQGMFAFAAGRFASNGDAQSVKFVLRNKTTTDSAVTLFIDGSSTRLTIASGKVLHATVHILGSKSDGAAVASYMRQVTVKNVGGTVSLVGTVNTLGTDEAASTAIAITADDTNNALQIAVTGIASETWRWVAIVQGVELAYGT